MIWRPLSTTTRPLSDGQPAEGAMIVVRTQGCERPEACGEWTRGQLASAFIGRLVKLPEDPEYLVVDAEPSPVLTPGRVFRWFAAETAALDNGQGAKLEHYGLGRLWCLLEGNGIGTEGLELARSCNRIGEDKWNSARGPGWVLVQTDRMPVRCWFARKR